MDEVAVLVLIVLLLGNAISCLVLQLLAIISCHQRSESEERRRRWLVERESIDDAMLLSGVFGNGTRLDLGELRRHCGGVEISPVTINREGGFHDRVERERA